jgi:toxin-antitoxin system PIN domain toxin
VILFDVNVLVYCFRTDAPWHREFRAWMESQIAASAPFGFSELVGAGFLRVVTNPKVFDPPAPVERAIGFLEALLGQPNCVIVRPGPRHWPVFVDLCRRVQARGNLIPDAYLAALAIESGSEWVTTDRDYSRFPGLNWRHPLDQAHR